MFDQSNWKKKSNDNAVSGCIEHIRMLLQRKNKEAFFSILVLLFCLVYYACYYIVCLIYVLNKCNCLKKSHFTTIVKIIALLLNPIFMPKP